jgi:hypothetical protein
MSDDFDTDWTMISFDPPKTGAVKAAPVLKGVCPKCGRKLGRGGHFHIKACHGPDGEN